MRNKLAVAGAVLAVVGILGAGVTVRWLAQLEHRVEARFAGKLFKIPARVYSGPLLLYPGLDMRRLALEDRLAQLNYHRARGTELSPGEYRRRGARLEIERRPFRFAHREDPGGRLVLELDGDGVLAELRDGSGRSLDTAELEPELIAVFTGPEGQDRELVTATEVAPELVQAILAIEDQRFFEHHGIDPRRVLGAAWANLRAARVVQGGSTLTQQLVKNFYLTRERTLGRKLEEAAMALILERNHTKEEILDAYLNEVYMGQRGGVAIHGMGEAALHFFGKRAADLSVAESALLAGLIQGPSHLSPRKHPERARQRRDLVLSVMLDLGLIDLETHDAARASELGVVDAPLASSPAPYFVEHVRQELARAYGDELLESEGLSIFTTLDPELQRAANRAVELQLERLERDRPDLVRADPVGDRQRLQGAVLALAPRTGEILAMVGGRDFHESQFNRATQAHRQPGSVFKPVVALAAFASGGLSRFTPATRLEDAPLTVDLPNGTWSPENYDGAFRGQVSLREAFEQSLNVPVARLGLAVGPARIVETARRMGIESPLLPLPSLALGSFELTLLEATTAYAVLAAEGVVPVPRAYTEVLHPDGRVLEVRERELERAFDPAATYLVTSLLVGAVERGTAHALRERGFEGDVAGKTGTSSDSRDAWFIGYTPDVVIGVWVGFDDGRSLGLSGATAALPIFADVLEVARGKRAGPEFPRPPGVIDVEIDPRTGLLASARCPGEPEVFLTGTAPASDCGGGAPQDGHGVLERLRGWLRRAL
jgi:penicillin-binding protein 1B